MSQAAQAVQKAVAELAAAKAAKKSEPATKLKKPAPTATAPTGEKTVAEKKMRTRKPRPKKTKVETGALTLKEYRLIDGIPDAIRDKTAAKAVLEVIKKHGPATRKEIRAELPRSYKEPTLNFYLGKFQRKPKLITTKSASA